MESLWILSASAVLLALLHTWIGPDHYLPFVALARARRWSLRRTAAITALCGLGHVLTSVLLGGIGIGAGIALGRIERLESARGRAAAWLLIGFGIAYAAWGWRRVRRGRRHAHRHTHTDGTRHSHPHRHDTEHSHLHLPAGATIWWLVIAFGLGPCEPLIPLLMYPAAVHGAAGVIWIGVLFGVTTIAAMTGTVAVLLSGATRMRFSQRLEPYGHLLAGSTIALSGLAVQWFGI